MRATYLTGEHIYLRAMTKADAAVAMAWRQSPFPTSQAQAEKQLEEAHQNLWQTRQFLFAICRRSDDEVVGSVKLGVWGPLRAFIQFKIADWIPAPEAATFSREALRLTLKWQAGENERPIVVVVIPAWESELMAEAETLGMERMVRFRQHLLHNGERHDMYLYQFIRPDWLPRLTNVHA